MSPGMTTCSYFFDCPPSCSEFLDNSAQRRWCQCSSWLEHPFLVCHHTLSLAPRSCITPQQMCDPLLMLQWPQPPAASSYVPGWIFGSKHLSVPGVWLFITNEILIRKDYWTLHCVVICANKTCIFYTRFPSFPPNKNLWLRVCVGRTVSAVTEVGPFPRYLKLCFLGSWDYLQIAVAVSSFDEDVLILGEIWSASSCNISATPPGREREREHRKNDNLYFQNHNLIRTTVDNKPKQNQTTDSPSSLVPYWERLRISVQIATLASARTFFYH